jgi:formylmethanofuran dehydrogenase subunit E
MTHEHGGAKCAKCGKTDYEQNMEEIDGKLYCQDCAGEIEPCES